MRMTLILTAALIALAGCSTGRWVQTRVDATKEHDHVEVYLEHRVEQDAIVPQGFEHPFAVGERDLGLVLCGLLRWNSHILASDEVVRVFEPTEVAALAPALSAALDAATPDQRIRFISYDWRGGILKSNKRITQGVFFVEPGGRFNIAFQEIDEVIRPNDYAQIGRERTFGEPTKITTSTRPLAERNWLTIQKRPQGDGVYPLWCVVDLDKARAEIAGMATGRSGRSPEISAPPPAERTPEKADQTDPTEESKSSEENLKAAAVREKLRALKEMLEEGLITEEDYEQKKAQLLDSF